jgi:hypothetical protein
MADCVLPVLISIRENYDDSQCFYYAKLTYYKLNYKL